MLFAPSETADLFAALAQLDADEQREGDALEQADTREGEATYQDAAELRGAWL